MAVLGIGLPRLAKRRDRRIALAELFADFAEREPGRGKAGRELGRLQQQIGGGDQIALELQVARKIEPAVGNQIAGGQEQARGHGLHIWAGMSRVSGGLRNGQSTHAFAALRRGDLSSAG